MPQSPLLAINVKDPIYGALGDGITDDTAAIQSAINAAAHYLIDTSVTPFITSEPTLYFPPGEYKISSTLLMNGFHSAIRIIGDDAILSPVSPAMTDYAMQHTYCYHVKIEGLNFKKFLKGLLVSNRTDATTGHLDSANVIISRCTFQRSEEALYIDMESSNSLVEHCKFTDNIVSVNVVRGDEVILQNCWISSKEGLTGLQPGNIINHARLKMISCILTPYPPAGSCIEPAWINNYGCVTVRDSRAGGETGSGFALINNFAGVGDLRGPIDALEPNAVIVMNSICSAAFNSTGETYEQPAAVRYATRIPNLTFVEGNWGMNGNKIIGFSQHLYNGDSNAINAIIAASGSAVEPVNVSVRVQDNVGGRLYPNGTYVPTELFPYVRSKDSLWPVTPSNAAPILSATVQPDGSIIYRFEYAGDFNYSNTAYLINYTGRPNPDNPYTGGYVGILKANGFWSNPGSVNTGYVRESLVVQDVFNQIGDSEPGSWPTGTFTVEPYWEATGNRFLPYSNTNRVVCLKISGRAGTILDYDHIKITLLDSL